MRIQETSVAFQAVAAGMLAGTLDILAALAFWALNSVPPIRILQGIAGGLLGSAAYQGDVTTALMGLLLHFLIMLVIAAIYVVAASRLSLLRKRWLIAGTLFGIVVYLVMNGIVLPLSAFPHPVAFSIERVVPALLIQVFFVGWPIAFVVRDRKR